MAAVLPAAPPRQPRSEQNTPLAFALALAMHAALAAALWLSVQWRTESAGAVVVELWGAPPPAPAPAIVVPPPPPAMAMAMPEPERPQADIVVEQKKMPEVPRPEAQKREAEKRRAEEEKQRQAAEARRLEEAKKQAEAERRRREQAQAAEELKRDEQRREAVRKAEEARVLAQAGPGAPSEGATGTGGAGDASYAAQLVTLIRPRIVYAVPENTPASVYAEFQVELLPTGEILAVRKLKASGLPGYDEAVERAIRRTDPFPRKRDGTIDRTVIIRFRPVDAR